MQKKKNNTKKIIIIVSIVVLLAILLVPFEFTFVSDGGSHGCRAIAYSVWYQHSFIDPFGRDESNGMMYTTYTVGWTVEIFGIEVYSERHEEKEYTISISEHDATVENIKQQLDKINSEYS